MKSSSSLSADRRGAVAVEFAVAIVPLLLCFFCFYQVAFITAAKLYVRHAAILGARAAIVIVPPNPVGKKAKAAGSEKDIHTAVRASAGTWGNKGLLALQEHVIDSDPGDANSNVTVDVTGTFQCTVPLGRYIVCPKGGLAIIHDSATLPKQGAYYQ